ncbi:MAG: histidinol-phosphate transaminase [Armatimonadota bacterium]|nr:histidinol-phosphate transaminase [Armatimonadota bacterium]
MTSVGETPTINVAENIKNLKPYHPGRPIEDVKREYGLQDIIKLASNENPLGPSAAAVKAMQEACNGVGIYPDGACFTLRRDLSAHFSMDMETIVVGNGSDELIHYLGLAFLEPGDEVVQAQPTFVRYEAAAILGQSRCISVPLRNHTHDLDAMADAFTDRTRLVFIANPNNPTGTMNTGAEVNRMLSRLPSRAILVLDEAYCEYVDRPDYPDSLQLVRDGCNIMVLRTFSKIYGLAGLRVGYGIARPALIHYINQVREPFNVNLVAQAAAKASLADASQVVRSRKLNGDGKAFYYRSFDDMGLAYIQSVANFVMVNVGRPGVEVAKALERQGVIVRAGEPLGMPGFIRVTIGTPGECERFVRTLKMALGHEDANGRTAF